MSILQGNSCSIDQKSGEIWTVQTDLQQIYPKSDRLLALKGVPRYAINESALTKFSSLFIVEALRGVAVSRFG